MHFQKQDLDGEHYTWLEEGKKNIFTGQPTRRAFNRFNGDQVLFMINLYGAVSDQYTIYEGKKIEHKIVNRLPLEMQSEIAVFNWLTSIEGPVNDEAFVTSRSTVPCEKIM